MLAGAGYIAFRCGFTLFIYFLSLVCALSLELLQSLRGLWLLNSSHRSFISTTTTIAPSPSSHLRPSSSLIVAVDDGDGTSWLVHVSMFPPSTQPANTMDYRKSSMTSHRHPPMSQRPLPSFTQASENVASAYPSSAYDSIFYPHNGHAHQPLPSTTAQSDSAARNAAPSPSNSNLTSAGEACSSASSPAAELIPSHFEGLFSTVKTQMPPPGPSYYRERRALWLEQPAVMPRPVSPSPSRIKLEALLNQPGAVENEDVWKAGLKNVWKGLVGGNQLRKRLPLSIVVRLSFLCILHIASVPRIDAFSQRSPSSSIDRLRTCS